MWHSIRDWLTEFGLMFFYLSNIVVEQFRVDVIRQQPQPDPKKPTIIFVKRWFNHNPLHHRWEEYLRQKGFNVYFVFHSLLKGSWDESAQKLDQFIKKRELTDVIMIGISGGGITAWLYLNEYNGWKNVQTFIAIATPFKGTIKELFAIFNTSSRKLLPRTAFVKKLQQYTPPEGKRFITIRALFDELVPAASAIHPQAEEVVIPVSGHNNLHLASQATYDTIIRLLNEDI